MKQPAGKKPIVGIEVKIHRKMLFVYVARCANKERINSWKVYQHVTKASLRRLMALADRLGIGGGA